MKLIARMRVLITAVVLASYSPFGLGLGCDEGGSGHAGHLAISIFVARRTRVAASQHFEVTGRVIVQPPAMRAGEAADDVKGG